MDWPKFSAGPSGREPFFAELVMPRSAPDHSRKAAEDHTDVPLPRMDIRSKLTHASTADRPALLATHFSGLAAQVLDLPPNAPLDTRESLLALGLDSLMAVELSNHIRTAVGVSIPLNDFLRGSSIRDIVGLALRSIEQPSNEPAHTDAVCVPVTSGFESEWITGAI
jgi:acyl carrier protein